MSFKKEKDTEINFILYEIKARNQYKSLYSIYMKTTMWSYMRNLSIKVLIKSCIFLFCINDCINDRFVNLAIIWFRRKIIFFQTTHMIITKSLTLGHDLLSSDDKSNKPLKLLWQLRMEYSLQERLKTSTNLEKIKLIVLIVNS